MERQESGIPPASDCWDIATTAAYIAWRGFTMGTEEERIFAGQAVFRTAKGSTFRLITFPRSVSEAHDFYQDRPPSERLEAAELALGLAKAELLEFLRAGLITASGRRLDDPTASPEEIPAADWTAPWIDPRDPLHIRSGEKHWFGVWLPRAEVERLWFPHSGQEAPGRHTGDGTSSAPIPLSEAWRLVAPEDVVRRIATMEQMRDEIAKTPYIETEILPGKYAVIFPLTLSDGVMKYCGSSGE